MNSENESIMKGNGPTDAEIEAKISTRAKAGELPCAVAFDVADQLGISPALIGEAADRMKLYLVKCQLGLFGYKPEKRIAKPVDVVDPNVETEIRKKLVDDRLPCKSAWEIAKHFNLRKMAVSGTCETLGIKIKPCQLGAF
jgi:hypothetical protein